MEGAGGGRQKNSTFAAVQIAFLAFHIFTARGVFGEMYFIEAKLRSLRGYNFFNGSENVLITRAHVREMYFFFPREILTPACERDFISRILIRIC